MTEIVDKDALQRRDSRPIVEHSTFNNSYRLAGTYRFGEYAPTMVCDAVPTDEHHIKTSHVVKSYTMKQPLMQGIQLKDDTFLVPDSAILPRNYELFITSKNIGDDVNSSLVGTSVVGFTSYIYSLLDWSDYINSKEEGSYNISSLARRFELMLKYAVLCDMLLSSGSLCTSLGMPLLTSKKASKFDKALNAWINKIYAFGVTGYTLRVTIGNTDYEVGRDSVNAGDSSLTFREFWNKIHDGFNWSVLSVTDTNSKIIGAETEFGALAVSNFLVLDDDAPFDLKRCYCYQIICAHFYSNDKVDYIYSAELWRQNLRSLINTITSDDLDSSSFSYNGINCRYDECSAEAFSLVFSAAGDYFGDVDDFMSIATGASISVFNNLFDYLRLIFGYNRSLRYVDYFTGSRTRPLAVGDANVSVSANKVDVVGVIQKKWYIRLWSQISRVGRKLSEQMRGLFPDAQPSIDWHEPIWIHSSDGSVQASEVDNTADNQFNPDTPIAVTSTLRGGSNGDNLSVNINDRYGTIITITRFDISRFYTDAVDRDIFHVDRYDKFNPFLQFMGDQKVYQKELITESPFMNIFGYQGRYMEYKQRIDRAFGGFEDPNVLPGLLFLADVGKDLYSMQNLSPDYIRSYPSELDRFFISLSGWSLGTYFHFMMLTTNDIESKRPMAYNPQIQ